MTRPARVVIALPYLGDVSYERGLAGASAIIAQAALDTPEEIGAATAEADAVIVTTHPLTAAHIDAVGARVRIIGRAGIGLDSIDLDAARNRRVAVFHTPDYCVDEVADQTVMAMLALVRRLHDQERVAKDPGWAGRNSLRFPPFDELTVGIVGAGRIGRAVLARLAPFKATRVVFDPYIAAVLDGVEVDTDLDRLLGRSDIVSLHCPLTPETRGLLSDARIGRMKPGAYLVNVSRAPLVDDLSLARALRSGRLAGAAIDVFSSEPPPADSPLLGAPGVLLTPHYAWHSTAAEMRTRRQTLEGVLAFLGGSMPAEGRMAVIPQGD